MDGLLALELWDQIVSVLGNISRISDRTGKLVNGEDKHHKSHNKIDAMKDIDAVLSNVQSARQEALLYVFEDNEAVIKMITEGRSPTMRRTTEVGRRRRASENCQGTKNKRKQRKQHIEDFFFESDDHREVQKTVNEKRPHANMLRAGQFTSL